MPLYTPAVLDRIRARVRKMQPEDVADTFDRCFLDTLDKTVEMVDDLNAFVITGDIPAMWLRDSTTQLTPYLHFLNEDVLMANTAAAVSRQQLHYLLLDPYANAFNSAPTGQGHADIPAANDWVWERKFELDSLCYPIQLAYRIWKETNRIDHLHEFPEAAAVILDILTVEQDHAASSGYRFDRPGAEEGDSLANDGTGYPVAATGMAWSGFRPSDDACRFNYNIPGNAFAVAELAHLEELAVAVWGDQDLAARAKRVREAIEKGLLAFGVQENPEFGRVFAYEVDGLGESLLMDDANVPSLLSLPLLGYCRADDPTYVNTRSLILSAQNPYFFTGQKARGIGSPHTPDDMIWPIALAVEALTTSDRARKQEVACLLVETDGGTGLMHESFDVNNPTVYTRPWFSWANAMFCELVLELVGLRQPHRSAPHLEPGGREPLPLDS